MSKRKGHSAEKRHAAMSRAILKNIVVVFTQNNKAAKMIELPSLKEVPVTSALSKCVDHPLLWNVFLAVFCDGDKMEGCHYVTKQKYKYCELVEDLQNEHAGLLDSIEDQDSIRSVGWIASPMGKTFEPEEAEKLFDKLGAWEV